MSFSIMWFCFKTNCLKIGYKLLSRWDLKVLVVFWKPGRGRHGSKTDLSSTALVAVKKCLERCIEQGGGHVEQFCWMKICFPFFPIEKLCDYGPKMSENDSFFEPLLWTQFVSDFRKLGLKTKPHDRKRHKRKKYVDISMHLGDIRETKCSEVVRHPVYKI